MPDNYTISSSQDYYSVIDVAEQGSPASEIRTVWNAQNIGNGVGIFSGKTGHNLLFKSLHAGENITIDSTASGVTINSTGGDYTANNGITKSGNNFYLGGLLTGTTFISGNSNSSLSFRGLSGHTFDNRSLRIFNASKTAGITFNSLSTTNAILNIPESGNATIFCTPNTNIAASRIPFFHNAQGLMNTSGNFVWNNATNNLIIGGQISAAASALTLRSVSTSPIVIGNGTSTLMTAAALIQNQNNYANTTGAISHLALSNNFSPTSGNASFAGIGAAHTINQTGGANGQITGVNPQYTITSAVNVTGYDWNPITPNNISGTHLAFRATSGNVLIGGTGMTNTSSLVDLQSSNKTLTLSRISNENNITSPVNGQIYYNSSLDKYRIRETNNWKNITTHAVVTATTVNNDPVAQTWMDAIGYSFSVVSGKTYTFKMLIPFTAEATSTGAKWGMNGPTFSFFTANFRYPQTSTTLSSQLTTAYDTGTLLGGNPLNGIVDIVGTIIPTANGVFTLRFQSEVANSAITTIPGGTVEYTIL